LPAFRDDLYEKLTHPLVEVYRAQWQNRREADTIIIHAKKVSALTIESWPGRNHLKLGIRFTQGYTTCCMEYEPPHSTALRSYGTCAVNSAFIVTRKWWSLYNTECDYHQSSESRKGQRGRLIGYVEYGAERQGERYTAERCNEDDL
jgi:hypothetical protein